MTKTKKSIKDFTDEELLILYDLVVEFHGYVSKSKKGFNETRDDFCKLKGIPRTKLFFFNFRFFHKQHTKPHIYKEDVQVALNYRKSKLSKKDYANKIGISTARLSSIDMHLLYREHIEKLLKERNKDQEPAMLPAEQPFTFHQVQDVQKPILPAMGIDEPLQPQIIKPNNEIELIASGVRVFVKHGSGTEKLIKIIEFLEGL